MIVLTAHAVNEEARLRNRCGAPTLRQARDERPGAEKNDQNDAQRREDDEDRFIGAAQIVSSHAR
jgi:hypothetical protein